MTNPILRLRQKLKLTQHELSKLTGIPQGTLANWEKGNRHPMIQRAFKLIEFAKSKGVIIDIHDIYTDMKKS
jgi:DNA-binding XRE family transcriptional regulator